MAPDLTSLRHRARALAGVVLAATFALTACSTDADVSSSPAVGVATAHQQLVQSCELTRETFYTLKDDIDSALAKMADAAQSLAVTESPSAADRTNYGTIASASGKIVSELRAIVPELSSGTIAQAVTDYVTPFGVLSDYFQAMSAESPILPADETIASATAALTSAQGSLATLCSWSN